jgi:LexA DNA binding domain.
MKTGENKDVFIQNGTPLRFLLRLRCSGYSGFIIGWKTSGVKKWLSRKFVLMHKNQIHDPRKVLKFITKHKVKHGGDSPTLREIGDACDIPAPSNVREILLKLERDGKVILRRGQIELPGWKLTFVGEK